MSADFDGPSDGQPVQGRPVQPDLSHRQPAGRAFVLRRKPPGKLLPGAHAVDREYRVACRARRAGLPGPARLRPVRGRKRHRHALLRHGHGAGPDRLGSAFPRHEPRGARRPLRRDERDDRPASQLRPGGDRPWRLWQGDRLRRAPGRALVEAISEPTRTPAACRRWTGWSTGSARTSRPTADARASSTATFAATT